MADGPEFAAHFVSDSKANDGVAVQCSGRLECWNSRSKKWWLQFLHLPPTSSKMLQGGILGLRFTTEWVLEALEPLEKGFEFLACGMRYGSMKLVKRLCFKLACEVCLRWPRKSICGSVAPHLRAVCSRILCTGGFIPEAQLCGSLRPHPDGPDTLLIWSQKP